MTFTGEHLAIGNIGHLSLVLSFTLSILACISYFFAALDRNANDSSWLRIGRISFIIQSVAVSLVFITLFYIIYQHYYEYYYAWSHSSNKLPHKYMISCFWEGQEGSFLLWIIWQALIGVLLIWKAPKSWEAPVMVFIAASQVMLTSMILGVVIGDMKFGSSPFILLREAMAEGEIFKRQDYLSFIKDGNGLNPLLQNNWMVIHPPTLFFGFATTVVPFAFALAGLWKKRYTEWIPQALPWALVSLCVLGSGIMMGAVWAYESLSFGGYWNWDPVENASLMPWLIMAAAVHCMVVYQSSKKALHSSVLMSVLSFLLVLYATFLTRSGILGDSSVHSFTDLGLSGQLLIWLLFFVVLAKLIILFTWNKYASSKEEDRLSSREFWMFIGALLLLLSAIHIITVTSIPVYNKIGLLFGKDWKIAPPSDRFTGYHFVQIPIAILIGLGSAFTQFLKYRQTGELKKFYILMGLHLAVALGISTGIFFTQDFGKPVYGILMMAALFAVTVNTQYIINMLKFRWSASGAALSHIGFGLVLIGALLSSVNKNIISQNTSGMNLGDEKTNAENILLEKNQTLRMKEYLVTYKGDTSIPPDVFYKVHYSKVDEQGNVTEDFTLTPNAQINPKMGLIANPDTKHYWDHDVFTHVTSVPNKKDETNDTTGLRNIRMSWVSAGDETKINGSQVSFLGTENRTTSAANDTIQAEVLVGARFRIVTPRQETYIIEPLYGIKDSVPVYIDGRCKEAGIVLGFVGVDPDSRKIHIAIAEKDPERDFIIMKAIVFPYINILWAGCFFFGLGSFISFVRRIRLAKAA